MIEKVAAAIAATVVVSGGSGAHQDPKGPPVFTIEQRLIAPDDPLAYRQHFLAAINFYREKKFTDSVAEYRAALDAYPYNGEMWIGMGFALHYAGKNTEAIAAFKEGRRLTSTWQPFLIDYYWAQFALEVGDKADAYRALERLLLEDQYVDKPSLYNDKAFASLRDEARFQKLVGHFDTSKWTRTQGWRFDIDYFVSELKRVNHKYRVEPLPPVFLQRRADLKRDVPKLTDEQIVAGLGRMVEPLKQGHISVAILPETKSPLFLSLPVQFYVFPEGIYIVGAEPAYHDLVGCQVRLIEKRRPEDILVDIESHSSTENPWKVLWGGMQPLETLPVLSGLGVLPSGAKEASLTLVGRDGKEFVRSIGSVPRPQERKLVPPPDVPTPLFLKAVPRVHWMEALTDIDALFVQVNQIAPDPDETMAQFGLKLRKQLAEHPTKNLILDVRHNNGGNTATYTELLRTLVAFSVGEGNRLYVLIGRGVYSATGNLITDLERLARPIFVGEPSGGFGNQDGDESQVELPYSHVHAWLTSVRWQYSHPWDTRHSIVPQVPVQLSAKDYFAGKDPALETIKRMVGQK